MCEQSAAAARHGIFGTRRHSSLFCTCERRRRRRRSVDGRAVFVGCGWRRGAVGGGGGATTNGKKKKKKKPKPDGPSSSGRGGLMTVSRYARTTTDRRGAFARSLADHRPAQCRQSSCAFLRLRRTRARARGAATTTAQSVEWTSAREPCTTARRRPLPRRVLTAARTGCRRATVVRRRLTATISSGIDLIILYPLTSPVNELLSNTCFEHV